MLRNRFRGPLFAASMILLATTFGVACAGSEKTAHGNCPHDVKGNECEYYKDGYRAGAEDGKASMSMAYVRHAGDYDSRFEPYYKSGYEKGWQANR